MSLHTCILCYYTVHIGRQRLVERNLRLQQNRKEQYYPSLCKGGWQRENADGRVGYNKQSFCISPFSSRQSLLSLCADPAFCLLTAHAARARPFFRKERTQRFAQEERAHAALVPLIRLTSFACTCSALPIRLRVCLPSWSLTSVSLPRLVPLTKKVQT